jgi:tRNA A37 threonylcarbamoyladenosine dehydratase
MGTIYDRTRMLLGDSLLKTIQSAKIIVFGAGGVGGYVIEALARAGVRTIAVVDCGTVDVTNINRQITALHSTVGRKKAEVMAERVRDINPDAQVVSFDEKLTPETAELFRLEEYDYIVDTLDEIQSKLLLIVEAKRRNIPMISSMGTGNRFDPAKLKIDDIKKAAGTCPLAKIIKKEAAGMGIKQLKVLFSTEAPHREALAEDGSRAPSSISFVPAAAGILMASEVIRDLIQTAPSDKMIFGIRKPTPKIKIEEY